MTENKPITTCDFFEICETTCSGTLEDTEICKYHELYQQLARKTQECEELKSYVLTRCPECNSEYLSPVGVELYDENKQLKAENEMWQKNLDKTHLLMLQRQDELIRAEQKLEHIKEIANYSFNLSTSELMAKLELILQIIDEVE